MTTIFGMKEGAHPEGIQRREESRSMLNKPPREPRFVVVVLPTRIPYSNNELSFADATLVKDRARKRGLDARIFPADTVQRYTI